MRNLARCLSVFGLALLLAGAAPAEDKKDAKPPDKKPAQPSFVDIAFGFPKQIKLSEEQEKKIAELKKEYAPRFEGLQKKYTAIMTAERQKAAADAVKQAVADGKKGQEIQDAVNASLKLTKEEQDQLKELNASGTKLFQEAQKKARDVLTDEQKEQLNPKPKDKPLPKEK